MILIVVLTGLGNLRFWMIDFILHNWRLYACCLSTIG